MSPYGQCYLCMRCMSTSSQVLNWRQSSTLSRIAPMADSLHCEQSCKDWSDLQRRISNGDQREHYTQTVTACWSVNKFLCSHSNTRYCRPLFWKWPHIGSRFFAFWQNLCESNVYNLIAYWVCSAQLTKSQIHIFLNLLFKWNSKSAKIETRLKI